MTPRNAPRRGVTLIELLVVMAIITALFALALMIVPSVNQQNAVAKGANEVQAAFKTAQGMAAATRLPHGVRFLVNSGYTANTLQYLEMPPIFVPDPQALVALPNDPTGQNTTNGARVELVYKLYTGTPPLTPAPPMNTIVSRTCHIRSVPVEQASQVNAGATLVLPTLGAWSQIINPIQKSTPKPSGTGSFVVDISVTLQVYPDAFMGTATMYQTFHFGIYGVQTPLLAEPTVLLPQGIAADLQISYPPLQTPLQNYDVMFSPNGPTVATNNVAANTNVYIWIRDITKITNPGGANQTSMFWNDFGTNYTNFVSAFRLAGQMEVVGVRAGGFIGAGARQSRAGRGHFPLVRRGEW